MNDIYQKKPIAINGFSDYSVDTNGVVYGKKGRPLRPSLNPQGYLIVNLYEKGRQKGFAVHTLVAKTFLEKGPEKSQVNHVDGNKQNNCVTNLEWVTPKENMEHSIRVLGRNFKGSRSVKAKPVYGYDIKTQELLYHFGSMIEAGMYFANGDYQKARNIRNAISRVINPSYSRKTYRKCIWRREPLC